MKKLQEIEEAKIKAFKEKKKKEKEKQDLLKLKKFVENKVNEIRLENIKNGIVNKPTKIMFQEMITKYKVENGKIMKK
jgi:hypothetical protein